MHIGLIHQDQRGISLIEMVTVLALIGLLGAAIVMTLAQVLNVSSSSSNRMIAVRQVQQAGKEVSKDVLQADGVNYESNSTTLSLNLTIPYYWAENENEDPVKLHRTVIYELSGDELHRKYYGDGDIDGDPDYTTTVARYILLVDPYDAGNIMTSFAEVQDDDGGKKYVFTVTAEVGRRPQAAVETRTYELQPRPTPPQ